MRFFSLMLLSILGLSPNTGNAGTLVGDWWQEGTVDASNNERHAITQPVSQSTDATRVTLGIKNPELTDFVDFFLIISSKTANARCQYTVEEVIIDSQSFPVSSPTHTSDIGGIKTNTKDEQKRLWREFTKGRKLSLKIHQACNAPNEPSSEVNIFDFSLKGSSAAYRFVVGLKPVEDRKQEKVKLKGRHSPAIFGSHNIQSSKIPC